MILSTNIDNIMIVLDCQKIHLFDKETEQAILN